MGRKRRNVPEKHAAALGDQMEDPEGYGVRTKPRGSKRRKQREGEAPVDDVDAQELQEEEQALPAGLTDKLLKEARLQQQEVDEEDAADRGLLGAGVRRTIGAVSTRLQVADSDDSDEEEGGFGGAYSDGGGDWNEEVEEEITAEDEQALRAFMVPGADNFRQRTLADIILERLEQQQVEGRDNNGAQAGPGPSAAPGGIDPKVEAVYRQLGALLSRYTSGRVPKALKVIPSLTNWEDVLYLSEPEGWSPHAVYQATRVFVSNLNARMAQRFLNLVLLPAVRNDIRQNRRLHFALFQALRKCTYKPGAFYKGLLLPLCASGTCTLREAVILSSVLRRTSIPVVHSAAALLRLADMEYNGVNSFFIRVLLDKRYALPYRVVDALVDHFLSFKNEQRAVPVVWHQSLLAFVQRYKNEIRREDKVALRELLKVQHHYQVSPEVYRELDASRDRGQKSEVAAGMEVQSRVGQKVVEDPHALAPVMIMEEEAY